MREKKEFDDGIAALLEYFKANDFLKAAKYLQQ